MPFFIGAGGAHKAVSESFVGVGGVWKAVTGRWIGVGGVWKKYTDSVQVVLHNRYITHLSADPSIAFFTLGSDGVAYRSEVSGSGSIAIGGEWLIGGGDPADYQCWAEHLAGGPLYAGTLNAWLPLTSARTWSVGTASLPAYTQLRVRIRRASDLYEVASAIIELNAETPI